MRCGTQLSQLEELHAEGHADDGAGERNARNEEAHRKRNADQEKPQKVSDRLLLEIDMNLRTARPGGKVRNTEAGAAGRDQDDRKTTKDPYQEKGNGQSHAVNTKPQNIDDRIHCKSLSSELGARIPRAIIHIKFIIDMRKCQW